MAPDDDKTRTHVTLTSGTMVSHYRIVEKIGAGGMGEVYLAEDTELNRKVALKFLPAHLCHDADCRARFKREAQAAAKLDHPNIVAVHEVGEFQGRPFFSMQHVEGQSLKEVLAGKALPLDRIVELGIQVCDGLQAAHEKGITHRDIKPSNILIDSHGRARIVDFGLASVKGADQLTKTGSTLGTIGYMSPEQVWGDQIDHRTDIFSLGVVLYEFIAGRQPFQADTEAATSRNITDLDPEPLARFKTGVDSELQRVVSKALQKDKGQRYQHADELAADLKRLSPDRASDPHSGSRRSWRKRYAVLAAITLLLFAIAYWGRAKLVPTKGPQAESKRKMLAVLPFENLGSPEDEYFADGITDEITGRLATLPELGVISRTSAIQYKNTTKNLQQIAHELDVDYVLEGTTLCDKAGDQSRVRIIPQLIRVSDGTHLWSDTYIRPMADIFAVQTEIATRIADILNITVRESQSAVLRPPPTRNMDAYQAYLRSKESRPDLARQQQYDTVVEWLSRAVEIDSTFAMAFAALSNEHSLIYLWGFDATPSRRALAKRAADRAFTLQPDLPEVHLAYCLYYYRCLRDYDNALRELRIAEAGLPNEATAHAVRAYMLRRKGDYAAALGQLIRAFQLNPRSADVATEVGNTHSRLRDYQLALKYYDIAIALDPNRRDPYLNKAVCYLQWHGDTAMARTCLEAIPNQNSDDLRLAWVWLEVLRRDYDAALSRLAVVDAMVVRDQTSIQSKAGWAGLVYGLMGDRDHARAWDDSARVVLENELKARPDDHRTHSELGLTYARLGRKSDALREARLAVELCPVSRDAALGRIQREVLAKTYAITGEYELALDQIEYLLSIPGSCSVALLRLDPEYDPLRTLPRYQQLVEKYGP